MARELAQRTQSAVAQQNDGPPTLTQLIEQMKPQIARALPKHMDADRIARIATTVLKQTPKLAECTAESFLGALMTSAQLGLEPGPLGESYLVPYGSRVTFIPGYRGLVKLAYQSGQIQSISAHCVHEQDLFEFEYGLEEKLRHVPFMGGDRGKVSAVYAVAKFKDGGHNFIVMSLSAVEAIRAVSRAGKSGPWVDHWEAMARKTAVRQLIRWLPLSTELQNLNRAAQLDESVRTDITTQLDEAPVGYIAGSVVDTERGATDTDTGEVLDGDVVEDPPDMPPGWEQ